MASGRNVVSNAEHLAGTASVHKPMTTAFGTRHLLIAALLHYALTRIDVLNPRNYGVPPEQRTVILGDNISTQSIRSTLKPAY